MSKPKELNVPNQINAADARKLAPDYALIERFLSVVYAGIRTSAAKGQTIFTYAIYDQAIGNFSVLYRNQNAPMEKVLTLTGQECVKLLEKDGYKVDVSLHYEEKQLVETWLKFIISW